MLMIGACVLVALGAGLGSYFALRSPAKPHVPRTHRSAILDAAFEQGSFMAERG